VEKKGTGAARGAVRACLLYSVTRVVRRGRRDCQVGLDDRGNERGPVTVFPIPDDFKCVLCKLEKKVWFCVAPIDR